MIFDISSESKYLVSVIKALESKGYVVCFSYNPFGSWFDIFYSLTYKDGTSDQSGLTIFDGSDTKDIDKVLSKIPTAKSLKIKHAKIKKEYSL